MSGIPHALIFPYIHLVPSNASTRLGALTCCSIIRSLV